MRFTVHRDIDDAPVEARRSPAPSFAEKKNIVFFNTFWLQTAPGQPSPLRALAWPAKPQETPPSLASQAPRDPREPQEITVWGLALGSFTHFMILGFGDRFGLKTVPGGLGRYLKSFLEAAAPS